MKVYDVEITCGLYEDIRESHKLFSTLEKAREYADTPIEVPDNLESSYNIPRRGHVWEIEVDTNSKEHIEYFEPKWIYVKDIPFPDPDIYADDIPEPDYNDFI